MREAEAISALVPTGTLRVTAGPAAGSVIEIDDTLVIGRAGGSDSVGALGGDPELSREHARFTTREGTSVIEDLDSLNGTFVNDRRIEGPTELRTGDRIKMGRSLMTFELVDAGPDGRAPGHTGRHRRPSAQARRDGGEVAEAAGAARSAGADRRACAAAAPTVPGGSRPLRGNCRRLRRAGRGEDARERSVQRSRLAERRAKNLIGQGTGELPGAAVVALVTPPGGFAAPGTKASVERVASEIKRDKAVTRVLTYYDTRSPGFVSKDRRSTIVVAYLENISDRKRDDAASRIYERVNRPPEVLLGGPAVAGQQIGKQVGMRPRKGRGVRVPDPVHPLVLRVPRCRRRADAAVRRRDHRAGQRSSCCGSSIRSCRCRSSRSTS